MTRAHIVTMLLLVAVSGCRESKPAVPDKTAAPSEAQKKKLASKRLAPPKEDPAAAAARVGDEALEAQCRKGQALSCFALGRRSFLVASGVLRICLSRGCPNLPALKRRASRAVAFLRRTCELGEQRGCVWLGVAAERGHGLPESQDDAAARYRQACGAKSGLGCFRLGHLFDSGYQGKGPSAALAWYLKACELGHALGCQKLSYMYRAGYGVKADAAAAARYAERARAAGGQGAR